MDTTAVILVDEQDRECGQEEKMKAHKEGLLHRAFSIFIFNGQGEMLLQQRALNKYHSGGLWTNACCSHPSPGEAIETAALRRLQEEMGFQTEIQKLFDFVYQAGFDNGLTEYEFDHVYAGRYDGEIKFNEEEVMEVCYKTMDEISADLQQAPHRYTAWFQIAFPKVKEWYKEHILTKAI
jgi:isopentenyl-diphosphate Delta-isomerase